MVLLLTTNPQSKNRQNTFSRETQILDVCFSNHHVLKIPIWLGSPGGTVFSAEDVKSESMTPIMNCSKNFASMDANSLAGDRRWSISM